MELHCIWSLSKIIGFQQFFYIYIYILKYCNLQLYYSIYHLFFQAHDTLEDCHNYEPVSCDNIDLVQDILADLEIPSRRNQLARELLDILSDHHIQVCQRRSS